MKRDIRHLADINEIVSRDNGVDAFNYVHQSFHNGTVWFEQDGLLAEFKPVGMGIYTIHTYGNNKRSVADKRDFFAKAGEWMIDHTMCEEILITVPKGHTRLRLLVASFAKACGETPGHILYVFSDDDRSTLCQQ